jgi:hypothetical protein
MCALVRISTCPILRQQQISFYLFAQPKRVGFRFVKVAGSAQNVPLVSFYTEVTK